MNNTCKDKKIPWTCGLIGLLLGGPISGVLSFLCIQVILKSASRSEGGKFKPSRSAIYLSLIGWGVIGSVAMPISWFAANSIGWNFDAVALLQSSGKYKSYRDWSKAEKDEKKRERELRKVQSRLKKDERKRKLKEREDQIKSDTAYLAIMNLLEQPICTKVRYYGHLSPSGGYNPILYGRKKEFIYLQPLDRPGEFEEKWRLNPEFKTVCFSVDQTYWSTPELPSQYIKSVEKARDAKTSSVLMLRDKEASSRIYVDCNIRRYRDTYRRNDISKSWSINTMEPFISVGLSELDLICENPGVKAISDGSVFELLKK